MITNRNNYQNEQRQTKKAIAKVKFEIKNQWLYLPTLPGSEHSRQTVRGKSAPPYLDGGLMLSRKYKVEKMIGGGGFGQIYKAHDVDTRAVVAVKVEPESEEAGRMILEQRVLSMLAGTRNSPKLFYSGSVHGYNFIVMQMLGRNLGELRKQQPSRRLHVHSVIRIGIQIVDALEKVHALGYIHRDVKPSNICVGIGDNCRIIYLVDFGMTRQFRRSDGSIRRERKYAAFRGTMRYVSVASHERLEQGPVDDVWCLYYSMIELAEGGLPWKNISENDEIMKIKRTSGYTELCKNLPKPFARFTVHIQDVHYDQAVDYEALRGVLRGCCKVDENADFEWDHELSTQSD